MDSREKVPGLEALLHHFLAVGPWANYFSSLPISVTMVMVIVLTS